MGNNSIGTNSNLFFLARPSASIPNVTGDGTVYPVVFDTLANGSGYNTSTGVFTANNAGLHLLISIIQFTNLSSSHNLGVINIVTTSATYEIVNANIGALRLPGNQVSIEGSILAYLNTGDTAYTTVQISNGTKTVNVIGNNLLGRRLS